MDEKWKSSKKEGSSSFTRSFSTKSSSSKAPLLRTSSLKSSSSKCPLPRSFSQKNSSISHKCSSLAKEQKTRWIFEFMIEVTTKILKEVRFNSATGPITASPSSVATIALFRLNFSASCGIAQSHLREDSYRCKY
ncbi:hypothetical protein SADUNF_Sadunf16G0134000 [Salix dunnii]|uniref:Uncharacterized protein n=1 Tax=Salix dunnii TaxID=1413687 RepID=A0A835JBH4_9ROSI|nr:hypothetical protein SADUNF_Sadunf16G0134000 [Salix dunnii]